VGRHREKNSQCRMIDMGRGGLRRSPKPSEAREFEGRAPGVWRFLHLFVENNTFFGIILA